MATKTLNTRIKVRYDTLSNWAAKNPFLLKGEVAVVEIPAETNAGVVISEPAFLLKVGTGVDTRVTVDGVEMEASRFKALPYITAQAGDVHSWAKASSKPDYDSTEIIVETTSALGQALELESDSTLDAVIADLKASLETDTNTQYDLQIGDGTNGGNPGQIRFGYKDATVQNSTFSYGNWVTVGVTVAAGDGINVSTANGTSTVSAKLSGKTDNLLSIETDDNATENINEAGLYVPKASVTAYTPVAQNNDGTVDVLTGIATSDGHTFTQTITNLYTKDQIDALINPGMEFKGVITPTGAATTEDDISALTSVKMGDSYKISVDGEINNVAVKAGDLIIAVKDSPTAYIDNTNWALIPAGDDVEDTYREIKVDGSSALGNGTSTGALDLVGGTGVTLTPAAVTGGKTVTFAVDTSTIATKTSVDDLNSHTGYGSGANQLTKTVDVDGTPTVQQATVKEYVDAKATAAADAAVAALDATLVAGTDPATPGAGEYGKKKVFTTIAEVDGKLNAAASVATVLGIEDIDMGDYLILDGGAAATYDPVSSGT